MIPDFENNERNTSREGYVRAIQLRKFLTFCHVSARVQRDNCGDPVINGHNGHIYCDGDGFLVFLSFTNRPLRWTSAKKRLSPFVIRQDGDDEGCIHIDDPQRVSSRVIRSIIGLRKKHPPPKHLQKYQFQKKALDLME